MAIVGNPSSSVHGAWRHSDEAGLHARPVAHGVARSMIGSVAGHRGRPRIEHQKGAASMSTQINVLQADPFGAVPAALVVLMTILAMLGIIANVAMA